MSTRPIAIILMGTTGAGKSTIGELLSARLGWPFFDGDTFHPPANKEKMRAGVPLTDDDRAPWLRRLHELIVEQLSNATSLIVACSALKQQYRDLLCGGLDSIILVHLTGSEECLAERLAQRRGHFMNPALLQSQLETLEPAPEALHVSIENTPDQIVTTIAHAIESLKTSEGSA